MKRCDRCGFESHGCEIGLNFHALEIDGLHVDLCGDCGDKYWRERREFYIPFNKKWRKEIERSMFRNERKQTVSQQS